MHSDKNINTKFVHDKISTNFKHMLGARIDMKELKLLGFFTHKTFAHLKIIIHQQIKRNLYNTLLTDRTHMSIVYSVEK